MKENISKFPRYKGVKFILTLNSSIFSSICYYNETFIEDDVT